MTIQAVSLSGMGQHGESLPAGKAGASGFARVLDDVMGGAAAQAAELSKGIEQLSMGQTDNLHAISLASARADLSLQLVVEVRNRLQEAYQEVMRMQV